MSRKAIAALSCKCDGQLNRRFSNVHLHLALASFYRESRPGFRMIGSQGQMDVYISGTVFVNTFKRPGLHKPLRAL